MGAVELKYNSDAGNETFHGLHGRVHSVSRGVHCSSLVLDTSPYCVTVQLEMFGAKVFCTRNAMF